MKTGTIWAMSATGVVMLVSSFASGSFGFLKWALALNGFIGPEGAVNASMVTYIVLAIVTAIIAIALSVNSVYFLSVHRCWNAALPAVFSILLFGVNTVFAHIVCVLVTAVVADQIRQ